MTKSYCTNGKLRNANRILVGTFNAMRYLEELNVDYSIVLKLTIEEGGRLWNYFICFRIRTTGGILRKVQ